MRIIIILMLLASCAYAGEMEVKSGFGYIKDSDGKVIAKAELPIGTHPIKDGYTYVEVKDKTELDSIVVYKKDIPVKKTDVEKRLDEIEKKLNDLTAK